MNIVIQVLTLIAQIAGSIRQSEAIANIISTLQDIILLGAKEIRDVYQPIKNIIIVLQSNETITAEQFKQLQDLNDATDKAFEEAAVAAGAEPMITDADDGA